MRDSQSALWEKLYSAANQQRLSQALFLVGPIHTGLNILTKQFIQLLFCKQGTLDYCSKCPECQMVLRQEHPDLQWIKPEKTGGSIKIEEIRALQSTAYLTPTRAPRRVIVIEFADRLNRAAANALLKILEEPAAHTLFILIAEQLSSVPATVLSRCQIFNAVDTSTNKPGNNLLSLGELYKDDSDRSLIINNAEAILDDLIALIEGKEHPCTVAVRWNQHELASLSWFLYLVYAQIQLMFFRKDAVLGLAHQQLGQLQSLLSPVIIFSQIDKLNRILKKLSHNININSQLALEDLLISLMVEC
jgi:DNA polymerase-3 subunit delta'